MPLRPDLILADWSGLLTRNKPFPAGISGLIERPSCRDWKRAHVASSRIPLDNDRVLLRVSIGKSGAESNSPRVYHQEERHAQATTVINTRFSGTNGSHGYGRLPVRRR